MSRDAYIVDAVRTPIGRRKGMLSGWHPADLLAEVLAGVVARAGIAPAQLDDVIVGCLDQVGEQGANIGRSAVLAAGFPESVPAVTVDRQCGSSQQAAHFAAQGVMSGVYDVVIAAGVESMSRVPMWANVPDPSEAYGPRLRERYGLAPDFFVDQGESGEMMADRFELTREELDAFAVESHRRAAAATEAGRFQDEILPVRAEKDGEAWTADADEGIRPGTTMEGLAGLRTVFREDGRLTAATSSQLSDGAAAILIASEEAATRLGLRPRAGGRHGPGERERRRDLPRPPSGLQRCPPDDDAGPRDGPTRHALRPSDHVRGRRYGERHHPRTGEQQREDVGLDRRLPEALHASSPAPSAGGRRGLGDVGELAVPDAREGGRHGRSAAVGEVRDGAWRETGLLAEFLDGRPSRRGRPGSTNAPARPI
jgi:hypothetical protein